MSPFRSLQITLLLATFFLPMAFNARKTTISHPALLGAAALELIHGLRLGTDLALALLVASARGQLTALALSLLCRPLLFLSETGARHCLRVRHQGRMTVQRHQSPCDLLHFHGLEINQ